MNVDVKKLTESETCCLIVLIQEREGMPYPTRDNLAQFKLDHCLDDVREFKRLEEILGDMRDPTLQSLLSKLEGMPST